jgi:hypothetical protein
LVRNYRANDFLKKIYEKESSSLTVKACSKLSIVLVDFKDAAVDKQP